MPFPCISVRVCVCAKKMIISVKVKSCTWERDSKKCNTVNNEWEAEKKKNARWKNRMDGSQDTGRDCIRYQERKKDRQVSREKLLAYHFWPLVLRCLSCAKEAHSVVLYTWRGPCSAASLVTWASEFSENKKCRWINIEPELFLRHPSIVVTFKKLL